MLASVACYLTCRKTGNDPLNVGEEELGGSENGNNDDREGANRPNTDEDANLDDSDAAAEADDEEDPEIGVDKVQRFLHLRNGAKFPNGTTVHPVCKDIRVSSNILTCFWCCWWW